MSSTGRGERFFMPSSRVHSSRAPDRGVLTPRRPSVFSNGPATWSDSGSRSKEEICNAERNNQEARIRSWLWLHPGRRRQRVLLPPERHRGRLRWTSRRATTHLAAVENF